MGCLPLSWISKYKFYELYGEYFESQCYKKDVNKVINKNGKNIGTLYEFVSKNFVSYYLSNKTKIIKIESNDDKEYNKFNNEDTNSKIENEEEKIDLLGD